MFEKNKWKIILSCGATLLPIIYGLIMWNDLPAVITTHWGADGNADGFGGKAFAVFGLPAILLVLNCICLFFTLSDKKQKEQNPKVVGILFWIVPAISLFTSGIMYRSAFGNEFDLPLFTPALIGLMFIFIGNYLPKATQNRTFGIKIYWTLNNEENWNKTHRLGGKLWVAAGLLLLFSVFLPLKAMVWLMVSVIFAAIFIPFAYSYYIYRQHQKAGISYTAAPKSKAEKVAVKITAVLIPLLTVGVVVLMFTGDIKVSCEDSSFTINSTYWTDIEVDYSELSSVEYRKELDVGIRTNGFGSARLSMGIFQNEEFGSYTLYAYTGAEEYVVLSSDGKTLVIGMKDAQDTQAIYNTISEKIGVK